MEKWQMELLRSQLLKVNELQEKFFLFQEESRIQLLSNQLQYLQSLGSIALAVIAILVGTGVVATTVLWTLTGAIAFALVMYVTTLVRELNDATASYIQAQGQTLARKRREVEEKVKESFEKDDFSIYDRYVSVSTESTGGETTGIEYMGEIAIFLFLTLLVLGTAAVFEPHVCISGLLVGVALGVIAAFLLAFVDWNIRLSHVLSNGIHRIMKKNHGAQ